ncbi:MAG TPA: cell surface protein SprA, partial [Gemmatimonadaceae bacterium]
GNTLRSKYGATFFEPNRAATMAWQTNVSTPGGTRLFFTRQQIDPLVEFTGSGFQVPEPVLWLTLLPTEQVGQYNRATKRYQWTLPNTFSAQRFRSIRTVLSPSGIDLSNGELLEFWTLLDTNIVARRANPSLILDFGDVSENSVAFAPETLTVRRNSNGVVDTLFSGRRLQGFDSLNTERDKFSHAFNTDVNDTGLPGDLVDTLVVNDGLSIRKVFNQPVCRATPGSIDVVGDPHTNCTVGNNRLDEEDIDQDNALNFPNALRDRERVLRYVVDLSDAGRYKRVGSNFTDTLIVQGQPQVRTRQWVLISIPFKTPTDSLNDVNRRKIRALRVTLVSNQLDNPEAPVQLPIAELRVTGAPWLDRSNQTLAGIAGIRPDGGFVITSTIGTTDSSGVLVYQPPPGVLNQADSKVAQFSGALTQINESSMRIQAGNMGLFHRAEAFSRFPNGPQYFLGYNDLRVWGRGRGNGWGQTGELQMYIKVGRDENNFYMYRTPVNSGQTAAAWTDIDVSFARFVALRGQIQAAYLKGLKESIACSGIDSVIVASTPIPTGIVAHRFAACSDGYMVYTLDPAVTAPNLAAVQELAVGILRVGESGSAVSMISPSDTLELWVDDIRLEHQKNTAGYAGQVTMNGNIGDFAEFRAGFSNRDPNFRELGEQPTFLGQRDIDYALTTHLEKMLPKAAGIALPLTITKVSLGTDPLYLTQSDIQAGSTPGLRKPKNDLTTYALSVRRTTPIDGGMLGPLVNNLSATSTYVTGIDRTEFQDGSSRNLTVAVDYTVTDDSARTTHVPSWIDGALGVLPQVLQAGPIGALRAANFRWNPTQFRITSGLVRGDDRRVSYLQPSDLASDQPSTSTAASRLWRNGSVLELRPTNGLSARWEIESVLDFRDYRDTSAAESLPGGLQQNSLNAAPGFERERTLGTNFTFAPSFSSWFAPRVDLGTEYDMLRDPNVPTFSPLPGIIGVDSVLAVRDSTQLLGLPRRMTSAQTASIGTTINIASAIRAYTRDSSTLRKIGSVFAPVDVSYLRSLMSTLDQSNSAAPFLYQLGLGGVSSFRNVNGTQATTAGQTGTLNASNTLLLPLGTSIVNRYRRTTTLNWIARPDTTQAQVDGSQTQFPDATVRWAYRPAVATGLVSNLDINVGYTKSDATVSLPSLFTDDPAEIRRTHAQVFPVGATINWAERGALSTGVRYAYRRQLDSLPGSLARTRGDEVSFDAGRAFRIPKNWGLGLKNDIRTRFNIATSHNTTFIFDELGSLQSRLQDNGRQAINLTADTNVLDNAVLTFQGSHTITFDNNLNRRFAQTVISAVLQFNFFGVSK